MTTDFPIRRRTLITGAAAGVVTAAVALTGTAHAASKKPTVVEPDIDGTADWSARAPSGGIDIVDYTPSMIIVHHTVSENTTDYSRAQAHAHAHWVQDLHMDGNGWTDTGYNFLVSRGGWITEGRHRSLETLVGGTSFVQGAHTSGQNTTGIGISNEGSYHDGAVPPQAQWDALVSLCAYACTQYGIPASELYGHMDFGNTQCPGIFHERLPQLRTEVGNAMFA